MLTSFVETGGQITNWYELQLGCHVCSGNQQEHNASPLPSENGKEWHRPDWPWIWPFLFVTQQFRGPLSLLTARPGPNNTHTPTHTHFKHWRIKEMDVIDCNPGWNKIHPTFYTDSQSPILNTHTRTHTAHWGGGEHCPPLGWPPCCITKHVSIGGRSSIGLTNTLALCWPLRSRALCCQRLHGDKQRETVSFVVSEREKVLPGLTGKRCPSVHLSVCLTL